MDVDHGWIAFSPGDDDSDRTDEQRHRIDREIRRRRAARGELLCVVEVRVYERGVEPQVTFPPDAALHVDAAPETIAQAVANAREALADWR
jgi:hypothetical protein